MVKFVDYFSTQFIK